jgi:hypothetical protein
VSNSFASALWATDWTARAMAAGIVGMNFHDLLTETGSYSPLVLANLVRPATAGGASAPHAGPGGAGARPPAAHSGGLPPSQLHANPDWYALLLTAPLAGSRPVSASVHGSSNLTARAFLSNGGGNGVSHQAHELQVVLVDFDPPSARPLLVHLLVPSHFTRGTILRLAAPSPPAQSHVELGASEVSPSGTWSPKLPLPSVYESSRGSLAVEMPASSAALVTLDAGAPARSR